MDELTITLNFLDKQYESLSEQLREKEKELDAIRTVRASISRAKAAEPDTNPLSVSPPSCHQAAEINSERVIISTPVYHKPEDLPDQEVIDLTGMTIDLTGASNLFERVKRIGRAANGKLVNLTGMTHFIKDSGVSRASIKNLRSGVERIVREHPEHFVKITPGNYRYHDVPLKLDDTQ